MNNNNYIHQIISHLAGAATAAAEGMGEFVQGAGSAVNSSFAGVKDSYELGRLRDEQARLFGDIGRTLFWIKNGAIGQDDVPVDGQNLNAEDAVDQLLEQAAEIQRELDTILARQNERRGKRICSNCGNACAMRDIYCPKCGQKLPEAAEDCGCGCGEDPDCCGGDGTAGDSGESQG